MNVLKVNLILLFKSFNIWIFNFIHVVKENIERLARGSNKNDTLSRAPVLIRARSYIYSVINSSVYISVL